MSPEHQANEVSWTTKHDPVSVDVVEFRRASGKEVQRKEALHSTLTEMILRHFDGSAQQEILSAREMQKPEWFLAAESDARRFMASLGFHELGNIHLIEGHLECADSESPIDAFHDSITRDILVSEARMTDILSKDGITIAISVLVHELTHNTAPKPDRIVLQQHPDNTAHYAQRNGWLVSGATGDQGSYLEEGFCEYVASLYRRQSITQDVPLLPTDYSPSIILPPYLQTSAVLAGPDAHTIELLAWGVEKRAIMSADSFIGKLFEARKTETFAPAMREVVRAINTLSPELYPYLKNLERSSENWIAARDAVYDIITL